MRVKRTLVDTITPLAVYSIFLERIAQFLVVFAVICLGGYLVWSLGRGLELTDEAYYVLNGIHSSDIQFFFSPTHWISGPLWDMSNSLAAFRAVGLIILAGSAIILALGVIHAASLTGMPLPSESAARLAIVAASVAAAWLYGSILNFAPSYNLLCAAGAYVSVGLFLLSLDCTHRLRAGLIAVAVGITLGLTVLSKFPTGISITGVLLALHVVFGRYKGVRFVNAILMLLALTATVALVVSLQSTFHDALWGLRTGLEVTILAQQNEPVLARLLRNRDECLAMLQAAGTTFAGPLLCVSIAVLLKRSIIGVVAIAWFGWILVSGDSLLGGMDQFQAQSRPLAAGLCAALLLTLGLWTRTWHALVLVALLVALPFLIALGTANPLPFQIVLSLASWGTLGALLAFGAAPGTLRLPAILMYLVIVAILVSQVITNGTRAPYRLAHPLSEQGISVELDAIGRLKVDSETRQLIDDVQAAARECRIAPGMPFLGFYDLPGLALILDVVPAGTPWLFDLPFAQTVLGQVPPAKVRSAIVALKLDGHGRRPALPSQLADFPVGYKFCGSAMLPFHGARIELWVPGGN